MSTKAKINLLSEKDYLESELRNDVRHEYLKGADCRPHPCTNHCVRG